MMADNRLICQIYNSSYNLKSKNQTYQSKKWTEDLDRKILRGIYTWLTGTWKDTYYC